MPQHRLSNHKLYRLVGPTHPNHPNLGQRVIAAGPNIFDLQELGRSIIGRSYSLAPHLHILETDEDTPLDPDPLIYIPTVLNLEPQILIFWSDVSSVFGRSYS